MLVQLFLTSFVMTRFGLGTALLVLPMAVLMGAAGFAALPVLWMGSALNTADNGFSYSINQSAKEALYVPTRRDEKYNAKAFIDMFVQRFAKALSVVVSLGITAWFQDFSSVRWLSVFTVPIIALWIVAARYAGRRFRELEVQRANVGDRRSAKRARPRGIDRIWYGSSCIDPPRRHSRPPRRRWPATRPPRRSRAENESGADRAVGTERPAARRGGPSAGICNRRRRTDGRNERRARSAGRLP